MNEYARDYTIEQLQEEDEIHYKELINRMTKNNTAELRYRNKLQGKDKAELWFIHNDSGSYEKVIILFNGEYPIFRNYICCSCCWLIMLRNRNLVDTTLTDERKK